MPNDVTSPLASLELTPCVRVCSPLSANVALPSQSITGTVSASVTFISPCRNLEDFSETIAAIASVMLCLG